MPPDWDFRCGAGDENRTRMTSLEGELSRALTRHVAWSGAVLMIRE